MTQPTASPVEPGFDLGGQLSAMGNIFVDPASTAREVPKKHSWLMPFLTVAIVTVVFSMLISPLTIKIFRQYPPEGMTAEAAETAAEMMQKFQYVGVVLAPLMIAAFMAISALLVMLVASVLGLAVKFVHAFSLLSYCSLISMLQVVAGYIVVKAKEADIQSMQELRPRFGLDLVFHEGPKALTALLGYFSLFNLWYIAVLGIAFAALARCSKGKGFAATAPVWILAMLMTVAGSLFQR